jgi:glycine oxidase
MRTLAAPAPAAARRPAAVPVAVDVAVVGAGVIGLSIAWRLAQRGLSVAVFDCASVGAGASLAATGMLAAAAEHEPGDPELLALALESQRMWPEFGRALEAQSGVAIDFRGSGTLVVALGRDEVERLRFRHDLHVRCGLATRWLGGPEVRAMEPALRPSVAAGLFCPDDHQVDPRLVMAALRNAARLLDRKLGDLRVVVVGAGAAGVAVTKMLIAGGVTGGDVVLAAGAWTAGRLLPAGLVVPVRPLKGQALALTATAQTGTLSHIVDRAGALAAKGDGRLIVGATVEERDFDARSPPAASMPFWKGRRAFPAIRKWRSRRSGPGSGELDRRRADSRRHRIGGSRLPPATTATAIAGAGDARDRGAGRRRRDAGGVTAFGSIDLAARPSAAMNRKGPTEMREPDYAETGICR